MAKTYRKSPDGFVTDGGRHIPEGRYRPGSRTKKRDIVAVGVHRKHPDLDKLGRAIVRAALYQAEQEAAARSQGEARHE